MNAIRLVLTHVSLYAGYFSMRGIRVRKIGYRIINHTFWTGITPLIGLKYQIVRKAMLPVDGVLRDYCLLVR